MNGAPANEPGDPRARVGTMFGRFELLERIGLGGMAEVWRARVAGVGGFEKILVVKKILPAFAQNKTFIDMLLTEARLCAVLQHTNIVQTYENGEIDGHYYIAMEYIAGPDLFKVLSRATQVQQRIAPEVCLFVAAEVAKGLHYAHNARDHYGRPLHIIHRDVSPSNVIVSEAGEVKVMDFGVARATPNGQQPENATRSGVLKGKLGYMSPEQVTGQPFDHRSDIFSLGIILYESLTLKRLFLAKTDLETLVNIRDARIEHKFKKHGHIEEGVRAILRKALARELPERYPTAMAMHDDIVKFLFEQKIQVSNSMLSNFVAGLFDPARQGNTAPPVAHALGPVTKPERVVPASTPGYVPSTHSLSFSPEDMRKIRDKIAERRAEQNGSGTLQTPDLARDTAQEPDPASEVIGRPPSRPGIDQQALMARGRDMSGRDPGNLRPTVPGLYAPATSNPGSQGNGGSQGNPSLQGHRRASTPFGHAAQPYPPPAQSFPPQAQASQPVSSAAAEARRQIERLATVDNLAPLDANARANTDTFGSTREATGDRGLAFGGLGGQEPASYPIAQVGKNEPATSFRLRTGDGQEFGPLTRQNLEAMLRSRTAGVDDFVSVNEGSFQTIRSVALLQPVVQAVASGPGAATAQGPLSQWEFLRLVVAMYTQRANGCLELRRGDAVKSIYFRRGRTQYIASNQQAELLGPFMVANGFISQADVDMAMARARSTGGRLGDLLVGLNLIKPFQLYQVLERQLRAKFLDAFGWDSGTYVFYENSAPPSDIVPLDIDPVAVLAEGVRERVPLSVLERIFADKLDLPLYRARNPLISVGSLRLQARESKALSSLTSAKSPRAAYEECYNNRQQRLALLHVMFLTLQTGLLSYDVDAT